MGLPWDAEVLAALQPFLSTAAALPSPAVGDVGTRRANTAALFDRVLPTLGLPTHEDVMVTVLRAAAADGTELRMRLYRPPAAIEGSLSLWVHGGGMISGNLDQYDTVLRRTAAGAGVSLLAPEYRLAPEHPHPTPVEDCYASLLWATEHADRLNLDRSRIGVAGDSAGGGIAAGLALLARDRNGPAIAQQLLIYPMLDDRSNTPDPQIAGALTWTYDDNRTGWGALLGPAAGAADGVPYHAAPARADDLSGLPPAYIDVGGLDLFRDESNDYARRLSLAGVPVELLVTPGVPHALELLVPGTAAAQRILQGRYRFLRQL